MCIAFTYEYRSARQVIGSEKLAEDVLTRKCYEQRDRLLHIPFKNQFIPCCRYLQHLQKEEQTFARQIGYSQSDFLHAIPFCGSTKSKNSLEVLYHLEKSSALFSRPTYEQLLRRLEMVKELLSKSELTTLHCHGLRNAYGAIHNEKLELLIKRKQI